MPIASMVKHKTVTAPIRTYFGSFARKLYRLNFLEGLSGTVFNYVPLDLRRQAVTACFPATHLLQAYKLVRCRFPVSGFALSTSQRHPTTLLQIVFHRCRQVSI